MDKLDDNWISIFEKTDKLYKDFYKDDVFYINIHYIYINKLDCIEKIKQESFLMSKPNYILKEEIIELLKKNSIDNKIRYSILSILKYNIILDCDDIKPFLLDAKYSNTFLTPIQNIDTIMFNKTINTFQDLNDLYFIFNEKTNDSKREKMNTTKKINLRKYHKKTIHKSFL